MEITSGLYLKKLREKSKLSLRSLAEKTGVSHSQISSIERGINKGSEAVLEKILKILKATKEEKQEFYKLRSAPIVTTLTLTDEQKEILDLFKDADGNDCFSILNETDKKIIKGLINFASQKRAGESHGTT